MTQRTATIIGQGYVGLPLAQEAVGRGYKIYGYDISEKTVAGLRDGTSHVDDLTDADVAEMLDGGYEPTTDPAVISQSDTVVICVPTPLSPQGGPDLSAVKDAGRTIGEHLLDGVVVILESTSYPGTTERVLRPIIEEVSGKAQQDSFHLAFSPERVNPGMTEFGIKNTPKLVGGVDQESTNAAVEFYAGFIDDVVPLNGVREAEMAKLLENTFRHVNIALVNEMAKFCHDMGIDIWEVIRGASTKPFGFMPFTPGPGVGGHCIPIDPNYLSYEVKSELGYPFRFVELAQEINNSMPQYVAQRIGALLNDVKKPLNGSTVLMVGVTYKPDIADQRESPAVPIGEKLLAAGANVTFYDPLVTEWTLGTEVLQRESDLLAAAREADLVVIVQNHRSLDLEVLARESRILFDTRGKAPEPAIHM